MQPWTTETSHTYPDTQNAQHLPSDSQHGLLEHGSYPDSQLRHVDSEDAGSARSDSVSSGQTSSWFQNDAESDNNYSRLRRGATKDGTFKTRIEEYENASAHRARRSDSDLVFQVINRSGDKTDACPILELPNEILTHILSHLTPSALSATALVSHRLHDLVTTPHAWRIAFSRYFAGPEALGEQKQSENDESVTFARRSFTRLTSFASWRSEYILRTRLLRSLARGKPSEVLSAGSRGVSRSHVNSGSAQLTYNSNLLTIVNKIHANFGTGLNKRVPRFVHGAADTGCASSSDPVNHSRVDAWGSSDPQSFLQFDFRFPGDAQYGLGQGEIVGVPNSMDVSQAYGMVVGEGCPGGVVYFRHSQEQRGRFLARSREESFPGLGIPKIHQARETVCSVWLAKTPDVVNLTDGLVAILSGSSMGIVTAYSAGTDGLTGRRLERGELTARWMLSPGVPIVALAIDDKYSPRRRGQKRVWAVALNALGEVFYLTDMPCREPVPTSTTLDDDDLETLAWATGRTVHWDIIEATRRQPAEDPHGMSTVDGRYSPRSSSLQMNLNPAELQIETQEIEQFLRYQPKHFQSVCQGWDMRRRIEVDFASDDQHGAGESVIVLECGFTDGPASSLRRFTRHKHQLPSDLDQAEVIPSQEVVVDNTDSVGHRNGESTPADETTIGTTSEKWLVSSLSMGGTSSELLATALDNSTYATLTADEDPLLSMTASHHSSPWSTPTGEMPQPASSAEMPGQRARFLAVGSGSGAILVWNIRGSQPANESLIGDIRPVRIIQTDSPQISCLALTSLYLVHGGNDGLVQAWDLLASTTQPIRTLNSRFSTRARRRIVQAQASPWGVGMNLFAAGAICLDPDPTSLRGMVTLGTHLRYWSYSSSAIDQLKRSKRRLRRGERSSNQAGDAGFNASSRGALKSYIENEQREMEREKTELRKERARLQGRFGVDLLGPGATEEEMLAYATLLSQEENARSEEERKQRDSKEIDLPKIPESVPSKDNTGADDFEREIEEAIRLSLQGDDVICSSSPDIPIRFAKNKAKGKSVKSSPPRAAAGSSRSAELDDLDFALQLSLAEEQSRYEADQFDSLDDFPALSQTSSEGSSKERRKARDKGKGKRID